MLTVAVHGFGTKAEGDKATPAAQHDNGGARHAKLSYPFKQTAKARLLPYEQSCSKGTKMAI